MQTTRFNGAKTPDTLAGAIVLHINRTEADAGFLAAEKVVRAAYLAGKGANLKAILREPHADFFIMRALTFKTPYQRRRGWTPRDFAAAETNNPLELDPMQLRKVGAA